jgi:S-adenosylmethionine:tRNA ribosyltransferase-isomerase
MKLADFDFNLPPELIAQHPLPDRAASRLLHVEAEALTDRSFRDIAGLLNPGDVLVFNNTRVINARLFGTKASGGKVEVLIERVVDTHHALAHIRASKSPKAGQTLQLSGAINVEVLGRQEDLFALRFAGNVHELLEQHGQLPLPPYITHTPDAEDAKRYQTVYAQHAGAVAAPTAGLHFDAALLDQLQTQGVKLAYVTLHVGAGTFQPVRAENIAEHQMHSEWYSIPAETVMAIEQAKVQGRKVIAVGTTSLRSLESAAQSGTLQAGSAETKIFITPGYHFRVVDRLITNFHLPKSTLMMLVSAFAGLDRIRAAYAHAIAQRYRFFSYGDAMLLEKK